MLYYIFSLIIIFVFLLFKRYNSIIKYTILTIVCYSASLIVFALYVAKDVYYYNTVEHLFSIPLPLWNRMMFLTVSLETIIRLLNFFVLATLFFGICFSFALNSNNRKFKHLPFMILAVLLIELLVYDPAFIKTFYIIVYPDFLNYPQFTALQSIIHSITMLINIGIVILNIGLLCFYYYRASPLRKIKVSAGGIGIAHTLIMVSFILMFGLYPLCLVKVSKVAGTISFLTAPLIINARFSNLFLYYLSISFLLICFCLYRTSRISAQLKDESFTISKQISASNTTSKVFCHYMKNELLAIQSELEILSPIPEQEKAFVDIIDRCKHLYNRLDLLYRDSKSSSLTLKKTDLNTFLENMLDEFSSDLRHYHIHVHFPDERIYALVDKNYFFQALHNIITNALDAMADVPPGRKTLTISLSSINNWATIQIEDTGKGISPENLSKIFTPFYSTQPISKHWGIGLSLTYKIIEEHEGHISIDSKEDMGTVVKIILPAVWQASGNRRKFI